MHLSYEIFSKSKNQFWKAIFRQTMYNHNFFFGNCALLKLFVNLIQIYIS